MMPFLSIPVILFNGGDENTPPQEKQVQLRLTPQCIESFYPCFYEGASMVVMMSGEKYMTPLSCEQIEVGLLNYMQSINRKMAEERAPEGRIVTLSPTP
jgi:hypothetical protein